MRGKRNQTLSGLSRFPHPVEIYSNSKLNITVGTKPSNHILNTGNDC